MNTDEYDKGYIEALPIRVHLCTSVAKRFDMNAEEIIRTLDLKPHPEGGYYRETYRSPKTIPGGRPRAHSTGIYYLLVPGSVSKLHQIRSDEMLHFYLGDPVTWVLLDPLGGMKKVVLGGSLEKGESPQFLVQAGYWFGAYMNEGGSYALMGMTVAPGFDFADLVMGERQELIRAFPGAQVEILRLT